MVCDEVFKDWIRFIDGVGYDFQKAFFSFAGLDYDESMACCWNFFEHLDMTVEQFIDVCNRGADAGVIFGGNLVREGFAEGMRKTHHLGHTNHIITDRKFGSSPAVSEALTLEWLRYIDVPYDSITFSADKTNPRTDFFIEDKLENYDALDAAGTEVYLINRPWNQRDDDRRRIDSIDEYVSTIERRTKIDAML